MIEVQNISKQFFVDSSKACRNYLSRRDIFPDTSGSILALKDISFSLRRGDTLGLIGVNGAGKSTLLRIIAGISAPTSGQVKLKGRCGAILDISAGFFPELSGLQNIDLKCALYGLNRREIAGIRRGIADFSELGEYLDRPVKSYSAGMAMRLGFAVAVHFAADILLIDEIIMVGDNYFQDKCLKKIKELKANNTSIVFASHNHGIISTVCDRALWLHQGEQMMLGEVKEVANNYLDFIRRRIGAASSDTSTEITAPDARHGTQKLQITSVQFLDGNEREKKDFISGETFVLRLHYETTETIYQPNFGVAIYFADGQLCYGTSSGKSGASPASIRGKGYCDFILPDLALLSGSYEVSVAVFSEDLWKKYDYHTRLYRFRVRHLEADEGMVRLNHRFKFSFE